MVADSHRINGVTIDGCGQSPYKWWYHLAIKISIEFAVFKRLVAPPDFPILNVVHFQCLLKPSYSPLSHPITHPSHTLSLIPLTQSDLKAARC